MLERPLKASLLWVTRSKFTPGTGQKLHEHDYYHLYFVIQGSVNISVDGDIYTLQPQDAILAGPQSVHGLKNITNETVKLYEIKFTVFSPHFEEWLRDTDSFMHLDDFGSSLIKAIAEETKLNPRSSYYVISDYLTSLLLHISRHVRRQGHEESTVIRTRGFSAASKAIVRYLEENYMHSVSLQDIADTLSLNKNYLCTVFKNDCKFTIIDCLTTIRLSKASELISCSDLSLKQIAADTGFVNLSHFNKTFKKMFGITPGQYRQVFPLSRNPQELLDKTADAAASGKVTFPEPVLSSAKCVWSLEMNCQNSESGI